MLSQAGHPVGGHHSAREERHAASTDVIKVSTRGLASISSLYSSTSMRPSVNGAARQHCYMRQLLDNEALNKIDPAQTEKEIS